MNNRKSIQIAVVEDSKTFIALMRAILEDEGYQDVMYYLSSEEYLKSERIPELLITDLHLGDTDTGFTLSKKLRSEHPDSYVICITSDINPLLQLDAMVNKVHKLIKKQDNHMRINLLKSIDLFAQAITERQNLNRLRA